MPEHFDLERPERAAVLRRARAQFKRLGVLDLSMAAELEANGFEVFAVEEQLREEIVAHGN